MGGLLLLVLILPIFQVGVSYVFSTCSYALGDGAWPFTHAFSEMEHLPYRHSCIPISGGYIFSIILVILR